MKLLLKAILLISCFSTSHYSFAEADANNDKSNINTDIKNLKSQVLELNRELHKLEQDLLFSANAQINVFLSMDQGRFFHLDSVQLEIDNIAVSNYLYTSRGNKALGRGGVQRLYTGNIPPGEHEITAIFIGQGPDKKTQKHKASKKINKTGKNHFVELKIINSESLGKKHTEFSMKNWEQ